MTQSSTPQILESFDARFELGGPVAVPSIIGSLLRLKGTQFLFNIYWSLLVAATFRVAGSPIEHVMSEAGVSEWYLRRGLRILTKLGLIRVDEKEGAGVIEIVESLHEKTVKALQGIRGGTVEIDVKLETIAHTKSGRTLNLASVRPETSADYSQWTLSPVNSVVPRQLDCPQTTVVPRQLGPKPVTVDPRQTSFLVGDRIDDAKSCAGTLSDIDIVSTDSIGTNTKLPDKVKGRMGRPGFVWVDGEEPALDEVWKFWRDTLYPKRKAPNSSDWSRLRCRLRDGASVEEMKSVILHAKNDSWLNGTDPQNKKGKRYDHIENLFNSHSKFEKYLADAESSKTAIHRDARGIDMRLRATDEPTTVHVRR
jgi:hypothetical protein